MPRRAGISRRRRGRPVGVPMNGPSRESETAVTVPRMWFGSWNGVPHRLAGGTVSGLFSSCSVVNG